MRLYLTFVVLLTIATIASGLTWQRFADARGGEAAARLIVLSTTPVALAAFVLLVRIVTRVTALRSNGRRP